MDYILECMKKTSFVFEGYVLLQNGYGVNAPKAVAFCAASIGTGKEKWGAVPGKEYYVFEIMDIKEVRKND